MNSSMYYGVPKPKSWARAFRANGQGVCCYCSVKIEKGTMKIGLANGFGGRPSVHRWCAFKLLLQSFIGWTR